MSKSLIALTFCIGCGCQGGMDSDRGPATGLEFSQNEKAQSASKDADPAKTKFYTYKLPTDVQSQTVSGLEVVLQADSPPSPEGYYIDLFAVRPAKDKEGNLQRLPLGGQDVFKPLKKGETTTVYLNAPSKDAWLQGKTGEELKLEFQIKPANPNRKKPNVTLRIVDVKVTPVK